MRTPSHRLRTRRTALAAVLVGSLSVSALAGDPPVAGERIYRERCASCHGEAGQGVEKGYARPLVGKKSLEQLTRYIEKSMPEDDPGTCVGEEAAQVARYIFDAFYSPIAQARNRPPRIDLARLTVPQYRNAVADLVGSFRAPFRPGEGRGLRGEYFNSRRPGDQKVLERTDPRVEFDFGKVSPAPDKLDGQGFSARWEGSVIAPATGGYEFIVRTDHATRLWVNDMDRPLIDAWVKSGSGTEHRGAIFLLAGHAYPLRLEFSSRKQGVDDKKKQEAAKPVEAFIQFEWRLPGRTAEVIPSRHLLPDRGPEVFVVETPFPPDDRSIGYERGSSVSKEWIEAAVGAAIETAGYVASRLGELAGAPKSAGDREARVLAFCVRLVERAFRRPLSDAWKSDVERELREAPDLEAGVKRVVLLALNSPRFLYLDLEGEARDGYSVASRLSFALWDSLPDGELLEAAAAGRLASTEEARRQAERMILDLRARSKMSQFLHHWLQVEDGTHLAKDPKRFPGFGEDLASDLRTSLDLFLEDVIWSERSDFRDLLLSTDIYLNGRMVQYYGFNLPVGASFQKVTGPPGRPGVLSHPYLMASFAYTDTTSPIHRGVFLIRSLLGRPLRPPPEAFAPLSPDLHPGLTTRERVALQTGPETCQSCHGRINPLGFVLEHFDATGRYRDEEKGKPIDSSGYYELASGERRTFGGARDLAEFLAGSDEAHRAFVVHLFHHVVKQPVAAHGAETLARLQESFVASGFNVRRLLVEIATTAALPAAGGAPGGAALESAARPGYDASRARPAGERSF